MADIPCAATLAPSSSFDSLSSPEVLHVFARRTRDWHRSLLLRSELWPDESYISRAAREQVASGRWNGDAAGFSLRHRRNAARAQAALPHAGLAASQRRGACGQRGSFAARHWRQRALADESALLRCA